MILLKKIFLFLLAFILILSGCTKTPETSPKAPLSSLPEAEESSLPSESAPEQEPAEELYSVSIVTIKTKDAFIEPTDEVFDLVLVKPEETVMSEEYQKVSSKPGSLFGIPKSSKSLRSHVP